MSTGDEQELVMAVAAGDEGLEWAAMDAGRAGGPEPLSASAREGAGFAAATRRAGVVWVHTPSEQEALSTGPWGEAVKGKVVALGPLVAILLPSLQHYRWPRVLEEVGLGGHAGAEGLLELARTLRERVAGAPDRLREMWAVLLDPRSAEALGLVRQVGGGAAVAVLVASLAAQDPPKRQAAEVVDAADLAGIVDRIFGSDGALAEAHPVFEHREGQQQFARAVAETFERDEILLAEAGTGTGKSLAYLIPAALWALAGHRPVVVATYTRNLQDQLMQRDMPIVERALGKRLTTLVVKGRSNYPCARLVLGLLDRSMGSLFGEGRAAAAYLASRMAQSGGADLETISPEAGEIVEGLATAIEEVRAHYWRCARGMGVGCPLERACAVRRLRTAAQQADLLITNQAVLMFDTGIELPGYRYAVVDEAHHLDEAATNAMTGEVGTRALREAERLLVGEGPGTVVHAMLEGARIVAPQGGWLGEQQAWWDGWAQDWIAAADVLGQAVVKVLKRTDARGDEPVTVRLTDELMMTERWADVEAAAEKLAAMASEAADTLGPAAKRLEHEARELRVEATEPLSDLAGAVTVVAEIGATLRAVLQAETGRVAWAEAQREHGTWRWALCVAPVEVGDALGEVLYKKCRGLVLTGATLTVDRTFDFYRRACGIEAQSQRTMELQVASPFDWQKQLLILMPRDLPEPGGPDHEHAVTEAIRRLAELSGGGLLALFTSRRRMLDAYEALGKPLRQKGMTVLCQDVSGERWWLMDQMRSDDRTVVLGVRSLWEGVDVPGRHLRCVVVEKLPFAVPDEPLVEARMEYLEAQGEDAYMSYYVPEAIRALRQGVGRVIRTARDRGVVLLMDPRVWTRRYGRMVTRSLPPATVKRGGIEECLAAAGRWLAEGDGDDDEG
jgi:ATP-dependent DNA helicase DinG